MRYEQLMIKCINLAKQGEGKTSPNPLVGCIILDKNGEEISSGYHERYGDNHAERNALLKLKGKEAEGGTLIVNLEPCSHYGKTPPCADLIIKKGIKKVIIGMIDPNPIVCKNGIKKLQEAGIEIIKNILEEDCIKLNEVFVKNINKNLPFVAIKTAATLDGKIATNTGSSKWITSDEARNEVKKIRSKYDAILTSSTTVIADNPSMEHNLKIILDRELKTDLNSKIYQKEKIMVFHDEKLSAPASDKIIYYPAPVIDNKLDINFILKKLYDEKIMSVLVESGGKLNGEMLKYTDKIYHFIAPKIIGDNTSKSCFDYRNVSNINDAIKFNIDRIDIFEPDILLTYYPI